MFEHAEKMLNEAQKKYGAKNIFTLAATRQGINKIASDVGSKSGEAITLNKTVVGQDLFKKNQGKRRMKPTYASLATRAGAGVRDPPPIQQRF